MRALALLLFLVACGHAPDTGVDASLHADATSHDGSPIHLDAANVGPNVDAAPVVDAYTAACDTVTSDRTVHGGDVVTTCLSSDADVDTYRFTAPNDRAGGLMRMNVDFTDCEISFALWLDSDNTNPILETDDSSDTQTIGQLDHNLIQTVSPGVGYHLVVQKRRPFTGSCAYTLTTQYAAINDPYEPNQTAGNVAPTITAGTNVVAYMACESTTRELLVNNCSDYYQLDLAAAQYAMTLNLPSAPIGINPCLSLYCTANNVQTYNHLDCQPEYGEHSFDAVFNLTTASHCYAAISGSSAGAISNGYTGAAPPSPPDGADYPYTFRIQLQPPS